MLLDFPKEEDWRALLIAYPYEKLEISETLFETAHPVGSLERMVASQDILVWTVHLQNRLAQTRWSHMMFMYYFNKGIPDDEWFTSPGRKGQSIEYYPHFNESDHRVKGLFDYYVDVFYYKLFSAWDNLGQLLNVTYELEIDRPTFHKVVDALSGVNTFLHSRLAAIRDSDDFKTMREFRHAVTHNELLGHIGSMFRRSQNGITLGTGRYIPSKQIKENAIKSLDLFGSAIATLKEQKESAGPQ
jgi:Cthe_2314-like HEPN